MYAHNVDALTIFNRFFRAQPKRRLLQGQMSEHGRSGLWHRQPDLQEQMHTLSAKLFEQSDRPD